MRTTVNTHSPAFPRSLREKTDVSLFGALPVTEHRSSGDARTAAAYVPLRGPFKHRLVFTFLPPANVTVSTAELGELSFSSGSGKRTK